jgi:GT2 family glycosyltransferase
VRAAESVLLEKLDTQVIVVDNSADEAESSALLEQLPPGVECIVNDENVGFGKACNLGFTKAKHDWIFLLNPDAYVLEGCLNNLLDFLVGMPDAGAVAPLAYWDENKSWVLPPGLLETPLRNLIRTLAIRWRWLGRIVSGHYRRWVYRCNTSKNETSQRMVSGGHVLLRRSAVEKVGGLFDPQFFMYFEDADLSLRLQNSGFGLYYLPTAQVVHEWQDNAAEEELGIPSRKYYFQKNFAGSWLHSLSAKLAGAESDLPLKESTDLGFCNSSPNFSFSTGFKEGWLLEFSSNCLLAPSIFHEGKGVSFQFPHALWERLDDGRYWARVSDQNKANVELFSWQKVSKTSPEQDI